MFEGLDLDHFRGDTKTKFLNLLSDVMKESEARPSSYQHDGEDRDSGEIHGHCGPGSDRVCPDFRAMDAQFHLADCNDAVPEEVGNHF